MKTIAVMSPKGGIGKTTTSDSIAYILGEEHGKRVLILEGDQQGDTSETFGCYEPDGIGMSELIEHHVSQGGHYQTSDLIRPTEYPHIDIIPANGYLMKTDMNLLMKSDENQILRLRDGIPHPHGHLWHVSRQGQAVCECQETETDCQQAFKAKGERKA